MTIEDIARVPDTVLTTLDQLAKGVTVAVNELGLSVPGDVLVACLGDSAMITHCRVPITAVDLSPDELGRHAVDRLVDQIEGVATSIADQLVPDRLVLRASTISETQHSREVDRGSIAVPRTVEFGTQVTPMVDVGGHVAT